MNYRPSKRLLVLIAVLVVLAGLAVWQMWLPAYRFEQAKKAFAAGDLNQAEVLVTRLIASDPDAPELHLLHAKILRRKGLLGKASMALAAADKFGLDEKDLLHEHLLLQAQDHFVKMEPLLCRELDHNPQDLDIVQALAEGYARHGALLKADKMFEKWEKLDPQQTEVYFLRGLMFKKASYYNRSIDDFRAYLRHHPDHFQVRLFLADSLLGDARMPEAAVELEKCREVRPNDPDIMVGLAVCSFERQPEKARELLDLALRLEPNSVNALMEMTKLDQQAGNYDAVVSRLEKVLSLDPDNKQAHFKLGQAFRRKGDTTRAAFHESRYEALDQLEVTKGNQRRGMQ